MASSVACFPFFGVGVVGRSRQQAARFLVQQFFLSKGFRDNMRPSSDESGGCAHIPCLYAKLDEVALFAALFLALI